MLPNEYQPFVLTASQQQMRDRFQAIGFVVSLRPFAEAGAELYFFAHRPTDLPHKITYTVNLHSGSLRQHGDMNVLTISEAAKRYGSGERLSVSSPCESVPAEPPLPPPAESQPAQEHGGLTPSRSPEKPEAAKPVTKPAAVKPAAVKPVKKKQTALF